MGGQSQPAVTTQIQKTELPAWVDAASQSNYAFAEQVANRPFEQYQGPRVAGLSPGEQQAGGILNAGMQGSQAAYNTAGAALAGMAGGVRAPAVNAPTSFLGVNAPQAAGNVGTFSPAPSVTNGGGYMPISAGGAVPDVANPGAVGNVQGGQGYMQISAPGAVGNVAQFGGARDVSMPGAVNDVSARSFLDANMSDYMNPYTDNVVNTTLQGMDRATNTAMQRNSDANRASGAFGGSRDAISNAVLQSEGIRNKAATEAGLRSSAFTDAAGRVMQDNASALAAATTNQQKDITGNAQRLAAQSANQNADLQGGQLNAQIGIANQSSQNQAAGRELAASQSNQQSFLQNAAQKLQGDLANQQTGLGLEQLKGQIGIANQSSANTAAGRDLAAQTSNAGNFLSANAQDIAVQQGNQASQNTNNALNAGILQGNQNSFLQNQAQALQAGIANQGAAAGVQALGVDAQKANAANALSGAQLGLNAATNLGALGTDITNTAGKNALLSSQLGANERGVEQARLDTEAAKWQEAYNAPLEALNTRLAALGMSPYGKTTSTTETKTGGSSSNGAMSVLGGIMSFLPLMFSDREVKKDVKRKGKIPGTDLNAYEYKYKKGFMGRDMPKQIGLMAQDVEKKVPGAVQTVEVGGKKVKAVDYGAAIAGGRKSRDDKGRKRMGYKPRGFMGRAA